MENVYIVKFNGTGFFKIGMTRNENVFERIDAFNTYAPLGTELINLIRCKDSRIVEKELHAKFKDKRHNGEFFQLNESDLIYIESKYSNHKLTIMKIVDDFLNHYENEFLLLEDLLQLKKVKFYKNSEKIDLKNEIEKIIETLPKKTFFTATDIKKKGNFLLSVEEIGRIIKISRSSKAKKVNGKCVKVYEV